MGRGAADNWYISGRSAEWESQLAQHNACPGSQHVLNFQQKGVMDLGGTPAPFTDKICKVVFDILPY